MERVAFTMQLKAGYEAEYKKRHDEIWPELSLSLTKAGIFDYSIFLDEETGKLFAFQKTQEGNREDNLGAETIVKKWWDFMADIMEVHDDNSPVCVPLVEVFHLE